MSEGLTSTLRLRRAGTRKMPRSITLARRHCIAITPQSSAADWRRFQPQLASGTCDAECSSIGIRLKVLAGELFSACTNLDWLKRQVFPQTAQGIQLDYHAQQRGIQRKSAVRSQGTLEFSREAALLYDVTIPEGTVCAVSQEEGLRFVTTRKGILKAGDFSVSVPAASEEGGAQANAAAETIKVLVTPPPGVTAVTNRDAFTGGADGESDEELRERVLESCRNIPNGTNSAFYREFALQYSGRFYPDPQSSLPLSESQSIRAAAR